jgi:hypothetical protein
VWGPARSSLSSRAAVREIVERRIHEAKELVVTPVGIGGKA